VAAKTAAEEEEEKEGKGAKFEGLTAKQKKNLRKKL
jgi:hypothetical protein